MCALLPRPCRARDFFEHLNSEYVAETAVEAALPAAFCSEERDGAQQRCKTGKRVKLGGEAADAAWWMRQLSAAGGLDETGGSRAISADACAFSTDGAPEWLPVSLSVSDADALGGVFDAGESNDERVGIDDDEYERASAAGVTVMCRRFHADTAKAAAAAATAKLNGELEAATLGVAPPVFAHFVLRDAVDHGGDACAIVVSARHCFTLRQMLSAHGTALADPIARARVPTETIEKTVYDAFGSLARRIRLLSRTRKSVMLGLSTDNVVFVPRLVPGENNDLCPTGYGYSDVDAASGASDVLQGVPMVTGIEMQQMHRVGSGDDIHDEDVAYVATTSVLARSIRAEFPLAHRLLRNKVCGLSVGGTELSADELPDKFQAVLSVPAALQRALARSNETGIDAQCAAAAASALGAPDMEPQSLLRRAERLTTTEISADVTADALSEIQTTRNLARSMRAIAAQHAAVCV